MLNLQRLKPEADEYDSSLYRLYNLKKDRFEQKNLVRKEVKVFKQLKQVLDNFVIEAMRQQLKVAEYYLDPSGPKPPDDDTKIKLKTLGYIQ